MHPVEYDDMVIRPYTHGSLDDRKGYILRNKVLSLSNGIDDKALAFIYQTHDDEAEHIKLGAFVKDSMVGTLNLLPKEDGVVMIKQFAVTGKLQGKGIGKKLLDYAHAAARELGYKRIRLDARENVQGFYAKAGYIPTGKLVYPNITLIQMYLDL